MSVNKVFILGNLGADPELRYTQAQMPVCTLRLATSERRKDSSGEWAEQTEWHSVVAWGKTAENCSQYLKKGRQVFVEGRLQTRKWQDQSGQDRYKTEIVANTIQFVGGKGGDSPGRVAVAAGASGGFDAPTDLPTENISFDDDDIPF